MLPGGPLTLLQICYRHRRSRLLCARDVRAGSGRAQSRLRGGRGDLRLGDAARLRQPFARRARGVRRRHAGRPLADGPGGPARRHAAVPHALLYCAFRHICNLADVSGGYRRRPNRSVCAIWRRLPRPSRDTPSRDTRPFMCASAETPAPDTMRHSPNRKNPARWQSTTPLPPSSPPGRTGCGIRPSSCSPRAWRSAWSWRSANFRWCARLRSSSASRPRRWCRGGCMMRSPRARTSAASIRSRPPPSARWLPACRIRRCCSTAPAASSTSMPPPPSWRRRCARTNSRNSRCARPKSSPRCAKRSPPRNRAAPPISITCRSIAGWN